MRSADDVEIRASEFQYRRNKSENLSAYLNTSTPYPHVYTREVSQDNGNSD